MANNSNKSFRNEASEELGISVNKPSQPYRSRSKATKSKLSDMKYEVAGELGLNLNNSGYNGDITSKDAGRIGGNMVKRMIEYAQNNISGNKQS